MSYYATLSIRRRFHQICVGEPYGLHTRTRQEMGQDIAGACGQLALVNPGKMGDTEGRDIEDAAGSNSKQGKTKPNTRSGKKAPLVEASGESVQGSFNVTQVSINKLLCYANIALPLVLATFTYFARK